MTDDTRPTYPVRDPAPGPAVILDLPRLWAAVEDAMVQRGMTRQTGPFGRPLDNSGEPELKQLCDLTGLDRNTVGRVRQRARNGEIVRGQRGGISVNAYLTLLAFATGGPAPYGQWARPSDMTAVTGGPAEIGRHEPGPVIIPSDAHLDTALADSAAGNVVDLGDFTQFIDSRAAKPSDNGDPDPDEDPAGPGFLGTIPAAAPAPIHQYDDPEA